MLVLSPIQPAKAPSESRGPHFPDFECHLLPPAPVRQTRVVGDKKEGAWAPTSHAYLAAPRLLSEPEYSHYLSGVFTEL